MKKYLAIILFTALIGASAHAFETTGTGRTGAQLLRLNMSARSLALGGGGISLLSGLESFSMNPAGMADVDHYELFFSHNELYGDVRAEYIAFAKRHFGMVFAVSLKGFYLSVDEIDNTGLATGETIHYYNAAGSFGIGVPVSENMMIGAGITGIYQDGGYDGYTAFNYGFNGGIKISLMDKRIKVAASVRNASTDRISMKENSADFPMPLVGNAGISYTFRNHELRDKLILTADAEGYWEKSVTLSGGVEYLWTDWLFLRAGYRHKENYEIVDCISFGFGVRETIKKLTGHLDYAYTPYGDMGAAHRISYGLNW